MPTPIEVTTEIIKDLLDKGIIKLLDPQTREAVPVDSDAAQHLIKRIAEPLYDTIKGINVHRSLDTHNASLDHQLVLTSPFPGMDEPWSEEKLKELDKALSEFET